MPTHNSVTVDEPPRVSVILPVFNDEIRLKKCLEALEQQTYPKELYEVIVVDNASTTDLKSLVNRFQQSRYCYEAKPGSYAARNFGLGLSTGKVIAFTDSDCIPALNWIKLGVSSLQNNYEPGLIGGAINLFYKNPNRLTGVELYEGIEGFPQKKYIEQENFGATANVFTYKKIIDIVGNFNPGLKSGGDAEWGKRVAKAGYRLYYADEVEVEHPARSTYSEYYKKIIRVMGGLPEFKNPNIPLQQIIRQLLLGVLIPPISRLRKILGKVEHNNFRDKYKIVLVVLFLHYVWIFERARLQMRN